MNAEDFLEHNLGNSNLGILLDAGCGDASFLDDILSVAPAEEIWGVDIDADALSESRSYMLRAGIDCHFRQASVLSTGFSKHSFNSVACQDLLHHLHGGNFSHQPNAALEQAIVRFIGAMDVLLSPGGRIIMSEYVVDDSGVSSSGVGMHRGLSNTIAIHNIKAEVDSRHGIQHSYCMEAGKLGYILTHSLHSLGYVIEAKALVCSGASSPPAGSTAAGSRSASGQPQRGQPQAHEELLAHFDNYIASLEALPDSAYMLRALRRRFAGLRKSVMLHGLWPQKRLMLIAQKGNSKNPIRHQKIEAMVPVLNRAPSAPARADEVLRGAQKTGVSDGS